MRKRIGRKIYDTDKSKELGRNTQGDFGNPSGYEEVLYKKGELDYFLLVSGGELSQYPEEDIVQLSVDDTIEWSSRVLGSKATEELIIKDLEEMKAEIK